MTTKTNRALLTAFSAAGLLAVAGNAAGQCSTTVGSADVIVGDVTGSTSTGELNYNVQGQLDAISLGTTSCNIGTAELLWIAGNNQHPVIGGSLFRWTTEFDGAGRFEQLGISWLKHGFYALSENLCCASCSPTNGSRLGVGCSDPYTAGRNGGPGGLGPRWQVNPYTGAYPYPPANPGASGNTVRKIQFRTADVLPSSATTHYYGEAMYVTADDALAGNGFNNASYRRLNATTGNATSGMNFALTGSTVRQQPAVRAWKVIEPSVVQTDVNIPGEGRLIVSSNAYEITPGMWRYEYSVYNLNSDRMVSSFRVPLAASLTESSVGFLDVAYRDGDGPGNINLDGTDWTSSKGGGMMTWSAVPCSRNVTVAIPGSPIGTYDCTNAIRFGTAYNFRFDVAIPPTTGDVTLGLHKAGTPAVVVANARIPGTPAIPCPLDIDDSNVVDADDLFAFLSVWFAAPPGATCTGCQADWDISGTVDADDIFAFVDAWFSFGAGNACP